MTTKTAFETNEAPTAEQLQELERAEAGVTEAAPSQEGPAAEQEAPQESIEDLRRQLGELKQRAEKAENDAKAQQGRNRPIEELRERMEALADRVAGMSEANKALVRALGTGATEDLTQELEKIDREQGTRAATRSFNERVSRMRVELDKALESAGMKAVDERLADASEMWNASLKAGDISGVAEGLAAAIAAATTVREEKHRREVEEARKDGERRRNRQEAVEMTSPSNGRVGTAGTKTIADLADGGPWSDADRKAAQEYARSLGI